MTTPDTLDLAPFPTLEWIGDAWEAFTPRPAAWQRLTVASERGLRGGETTFGVAVSCAEHCPPSEAQRAAYRAFLDGGEALVTRVLDAVLEHYRPLRARWLAVQPDLDLPVVERAEELRRMTELSMVYVHEAQHGGRVHLGIALHAAWDPEHGAGVLLLGDQVVRVGSHDDAMREPASRRPRRVTKAKRGAEKAPAKKSAKRGAKKAPAKKSAKRGAKKAPAQKPAKKASARRPAKKAPARKQR